MSEVGSIDFGGVLVRAIDVMGGQGLVGLKDGTIFQVDIGSKSKKPIMESHSEGEVWGLALASDDVVVTSGDDNKIKAWSVSQRKCISRGIVSNEQRKVKRGGASTLSNLPDSQCSRALAVCP
jgi:WD40 repeat protein